MDWNQISNYAARHTHTKSWRWGRPGRPAGPCGTPGAVELNARRKVRGQGPSAGHLARFSGPRAAPPAVGGRFQFSLRDRAALSDPRGSQRRAAAVATAPEGLSDLRPETPAAFPSAAADPVHRRRPSPLGPRSLCVNTVAAPPPHWPPGDGLAGVLNGWAPGRGTLAQTSACLQD